MSSSEWQMLPLEDCMEAIIDYRGKTPRKSSFGIPLITAKIVKGGRILEPNEFIPFEDYDERMSRGLPQAGDIVITTEGPLGEVGQLDDRKVSIGQRLITLRGKKDLLDNTYLKYLLMSDFVQNQLLARATGTTVSGIKQTELRRINLLIPPLPVQQRIADVLLSLDEKIELNLQANSTLEAITQSIFKEWFVDFNFPDTTGHMTESELGIIPEGWQISALEDICKKITDGAHGSPKSVENGYPMASVKDMQKWGIDINTCRQISAEDYFQLVKSDCKPLKNDVLIAKDGSYLKHIFVIQEEMDLVVLSSIAILRPNNEFINPHILSFTLKQTSVMERMKNYVSGAVLPRIVIKDFRQFKILVPPLGLQLQWALVCESMFTKCWQNIRENEILAQHRDSLLPKLMSGEIEV